MVSPSRPINWLSAVFISIVSLISVAATGSELVLGSGRGVDHATLLSKSLINVSRTYADLGFTIYPYGRDEGGFESSILYFPDGTYIDLFGIHNTSLVEAGAEAHAADAPEGLTWLTLHTSSTAHTAAHLRKQGHELFGPEVIPGADGEWFFKLTGLEKNTLPGQRIYFVEYNEQLLEARREQKIGAVRARETHRNGALGLQSVWLAVKDLDEAERAYRGSGFETGRNYNFDQLAAIGREIRTGQRAILLIEPVSADSPVQRLLGSRDAAFVGYSIKADSLEKTRAVLSEREQPLAKDYDGLYGKSLMIPSSEAGGAWLEFFE